MTDRPILFSAPMVRALLDGRKTQTRRILNPQPYVNGIGYDAELGDIACHDDYLPPSTLLRRMGKGRNSYVASMPEDGPEGISGFYVGDRLYVREEWFSTPAYDDLKPRDMGGDEPLRYKADDATFNWGEADGTLVGRRRAGMHMPRWASRITLIVTDVRVEQLQACSEGDAIAEGVQRHDRPVFLNPGPPTYYTANFSGSPDAVSVYRFIWDAINGEGAWEANPWIVAISFTVEKRNIDQ